MVEFVFTEQPELFFFLSYEFMDTKGNLIPVDELKSFRDRIAISLPTQFKPEGVRFENRNTYYSFAEGFCREENMPLAIGFIPSLVDIGDEASIMNGETKEEDTAPNDIQIKLSQYGIATIKVVFKVPPDRAKVFNNDFVEYTVRTLKERSLRYGAAVWQEFVRVWNEESSERLITQANRIDLFLVSYVRGVKVRIDDKEFPLTSLKTDDLSIPDDTRNTIRKMLVGLAISSYLWSEYSERFVSEFIESDVSTTEKELQFIAWRNALIYYEGEKAAQPARYREYLDDMILGLELLFTIRSSLQLLDTIINRKIVRKLKPLGINPLKVFKLQSYYRLSEYFDSWLLSITGWRQFNRYGIISHFHDFLLSGLRAMRIETWLTAIEDKITILKGSIRVKSNTLVTINLLLLTLILVCLTILLIL
jgi:hypothetical protein